MQTVLVTGASAGIGRATALRLATNGFGVILTYRSRAEEAEDAVAVVTAAGGTAVALPLDVSEPDSFTSFVADVAAVLRDRWDTDHLNALVNNAGIGGGVPFGEVTEEQFDAFHRTLFKGPYFLTQKLLPLLADGAAIVNIGSTSALPTGTEIGYSSYAAQKGAIHTLTRCWAKELAPRRIRVNAVAPGSTRTRIADDTFADLPQSALDELAGTVALGRVGEPDDIAAAITYLASPDNSWVTGQILECSGGQRL